MTIEEYRGVSPICVDSFKIFYHHLILMSRSDIYIFLKIIKHYDTTKGTYN